MKDPKNSTNNLFIQYYFVRGHSEEQEVETVVESENMIHGDILRLNYTESYSLLVQDTLDSLRFASTLNAKFVVKIDDDVYLDVCRMVWRLQTTSLPDMLYGGTLLYNSPADGIQGTSTLSVTRISMTRHILFTAIIHSTSCLKKLFLSFSTRLKSFAHLKWKMRI